MPISKQEAILATRFTHVEFKSKSTGKPLEVRRNGKTRLWKRQPDKFVIPCKYGMYDYLYITNEDAEFWNAKS